MCFKFLSSLLSKSEKERVIRGKQNILQSADEQLLAPTIEYPTIKEQIPEEQTIPLTKIETNKLDYYKPYLPEDETSKKNLSTWINYPGILKLTRMARFLHLQTQLPKAEMKQEYMVQIANTIKYNTRILASSKAAPVVVSIAIAALKTASQANPQLRVVLTKLLDGETPRATEKENTSPILKRIKTLVASPNTWPKREKYTINKIFNTNELRTFSKVTENYLNQKASKEVEHFISPKILSKIAIKHNGLWLARNRTLLYNSSVYKERINPLLRYNRSPLTIALAKHNHYVNDKHEPTRPTTCMHTGVKQNQTKLLRYGVIYNGGPLFSEIQKSCIQCERRINRPFKVRMGPALNCMFEKIQLFNFISLDVKGPMKMNNGNTVYILVILCLQTKYTELLLIDSRMTSSFLSAMNIVFTLYGVPSLILSDKEGALVRMTNNIDKINECLMVDHKIQINLILAYLHHFQGSV